MTEQRLRDLAIIAMHYCERIPVDMPQIFKDLYPKARCIIDCSEIFTCRATIRVSSTGTNIF